MSNVQVEDGFASEETKNTRAEMQDVSERGKKGYTLLEVYMIKTKQETLSPVETAFLSQENQKFILERINALTEGLFVADEWFVSSMCTTASRFRDAPLRENTIRTLDEWYLRSYETSIIQRAHQQHEAMVRCGEAYVQEHIPPIDVRGMYRHRKRGGPPMTGEMMFLHDQLHTPAFEGR